MANNQLVPFNEQFKRAGDLLEKMKPQMLRVIPKGMQPDRLIRLALSITKRTPALLECDKQSFLGCVLQGAALGLDFDPALGEAYMVPYKGVATFIPGYRGLAKLARQSGEVSTIHARVVRVDDEFEYEYGIHQDTFRHKPAPKLGEHAGKAAGIRGAYCIMRMRDGGALFEFMPTDEIEKIRARSRAKDNGPWVTDYDMMAMKTAVRRVAKLAPMATDKAAPFNRAVALDAQADDGRDQDFDQGIIDVLAEVGEESETKAPPRHIGDLVKDTKKLNQVQQPKDPEEDKGDVPDHMKT